VRLCKRIGQVIVAADDERIVAALRPFGTVCMLTDPDHPSGTDRVAEVAKKLKKESGGASVETIINVQGDEPEIEPDVIDGLAEMMEQRGYEMCTAATPFRPPADPLDPNLVKVVVSESGRAMYFSRSAIPFDRDHAAGSPAAYYLHVGLYAYHPNTLVRLAGWKPTPCEKTEKLEQLRALEHDISIGVSFIERATHGIDTPQQYKAFVERMSQKNKAVMEARR